MANLLARINRSIGDKQRNAAAAPPPQTSNLDASSASSSTTALGEDAARGANGLPSSPSVTSFQTKQKHHAFRNLNNKFRAMRFGSSGRDTSSPRQVSTSSSATQQAQSASSRRTSGSSQVRDRRASGGFDTSRASAGSRSSFISMRRSVDRSSAKQHPDGLPHTPTQNVDIGEMSRASLTDDGSLPHIEQHEWYALSPASPLEPAEGEKEQQQQQLSNRAAPSPQPQAPQSPQTSQPQPQPQPQPPLPQPAQALPIAPVLTTTDMSAQPAPAIHSWPSTSAVPGATSPSIKSSPLSVPPGTDTSPASPSQPPDTTQRSPNLSPPESSLTANASTSDLSLMAEHAENATISASASAIECDMRSAPGSNSKLGSLGKRGLDVMHRLRAAPIPHRRTSPRPVVNGSEHRRRSLFIPMLGRNNEKPAPNATSPTRVWLDWLETPGSTSLPPRASSKLRALRSPSVLSTSSSTQSLRTNGTAASTVDKAPHVLFGAPLSEVAATQSFAVSSPELGSVDERAPDTSTDSDTERPPLLNRQEAQQQVIPRLVTRSVESLEKWGILEEGLYRIPGRSSHTIKLRALWDMPNADLNMAAIGPADLDVHAVCSVLKMYLRELPNSLIPPDTVGLMDQICADVASGSCTPNDAELAAQLEPHIQGIAFYEWYLLRELTEHLGVLTQVEIVARTKMTLSNLALVLAPSVQLSSSLMLVLVRLRHKLFHEGTRPRRTTQASDSLSSPTSLHTPTSPMSAIQSTPEKSQHTQDASSAQAAPSLCVEKQELAPVAKNEVSATATSHLIPEVLTTARPPPLNEQPQLAIDPDAKENADELHPAQLQESGEPESNTTSVHVLPPPITEPEYVTAQAHPQEHESEHERVSEPSNDGSTPGTPPKPLPIAQRFSQRRSSILFDPSNP